MRAQRTPAEIWVGDQVSAQRYNSLRWFSAVSVVLNGVLALVLILGWAR